MESIDLQTVQLSSWVQMVMGGAQDILFGNREPDSFESCWLMHQAHESHLFKRKVKHGREMISTKEVHIVQPASRKLLDYWTTRTGTTVPQVMHLGVVAWAQVRKVSLWGSQMFILKKNKHKSLFSGSRKQNWGNWVWVPLIPSVLQCDGWVSGFTLAWFMNLANCNVVTQVVDGSNASHYCQRYM